MGAVASCVLFCDEWEQASHGGELTGAVNDGLVTVAQFSFWGNYLPAVYPLHLRGTGESFAANIGGRMIGTPFAAVTQFLALQTFIPGEVPAPCGARRSCAEPRRATARAFHESPFEGRFAATSG